MDVCDLGGSNLGQVMLLDCIGPIRTGYRAGRGNAFTERSGRWSERLDSGWHIRWNEGVTALVDLGPYRKPRSPVKRDGYMEAFLRVMRREDHRPLSWYS